MDRPGCPTHVSGNNCTYTRKEKFAPRTQVYRCTRCCPSGALSSNHDKISSFHAWLCLVRGFPVHSIVVLIDEQQALHATATIDRPASITYHCLRRLLTYTVHVTHGSSSPTCSLPMWLQARLRTVPYVCVVDCSNQQGIITNRPDEHHSLLDGGVHSACSLCAGCMHARCSSTVTAATHDTSLEGWRVWVGLHSAGCLGNGTTRVPDRPAGSSSSVQRGQGASNGSQ